MRLLALPLAALLLGCASEEGFRAEVGPRAAFELSCPEAQLAVTRVGDDSWGVAGCGKRAVYVNLPRVGYVQNSGVVHDGPAAPAPVALAARPPAPDEFVIVPLHIVLAHARGASADAYLPEVPGVVQEMERILAPAGVYLQVEGLVQTVEVDPSVPWRVEPLRVTLPPAPPTLSGFRIVLVPEMTANGAALGVRDFMVQEKPKLRLVAGPPGNLVGRVGAHMIAEMLGVPVAKDETQLTALGTTGTLLTVQAASLAHDGAIRVPGAKTVAEAAATGAFPDAVAAIRVRPPR
jgi:hypothetical protein